MNTIAIATHGWDSTPLTKQDKGNAAALRLSKMLGKKVSWRMSSSKFEIRWTTYADGYAGEGDYRKVPIENFAVWDKTPVYKGHSVPCTYGLPRSWDVPYHLFD